MGRRIIWIRKSQENPIFVYIFLFIYLDCKVGALNEKKKGREKEKQMAHRYKKIVIV